MRQLAGRLTAPGALDQVPHPQLADAAWALGHAGALDEQLASQLLQHSQQQAAHGQLDVQGLAEVLDALAAAKFRPSPPVLNQLLTAADPLSRCRSSQELGALLSALGRLGYQPDDRF
ncbi:hypothetical protein HaLaN_10111, partial [Haematococcus lacustris]